MTPRNISYRNAAAVVVPVLVDGCRELTRFFSSMFDMMSESRNYRMPVNVLSVLQAEKKNCLKQKYPRSDQIT
jgi:hypothetical protein